MTDITDPRYDGLDDELGRIIADLTRSLARTAALRRGRATHTVGIMAAGTLRISDRPGSGIIPLFAPGKRYPVTLRHASFKGFQDDAVRDGRSASLRVLLSDERDEEGRLRVDEGTFDLILTSGRTFVLHDARIFHRWFTSDLAERARILEEYPRFAPNLAEFLRRPASFTALDYYSQITYELRGADGQLQLVRFRLTAPEDRPDSGFTSVSDLQLPLDYVPRSPGDTRSPSYLRDDFRDRVTAGGVAYRLQMQLRSPPATEEERMEALDTTRHWPEERYPYVDLATLELDELVDDAVAARQALNVSNMPEGLSLVLARSAGDTASIGHIRSIAYDASAAVRRGLPLPPRLAALLERFGGPLALDSAEELGVSPATRYDGLDEAFQTLVGRLAQELRRRTESMGARLPSAASIMARGTLAVQPDPALPQSVFFRDGATYPVTVRHRSDHPLTDDAIADGRVACLRIHPDPEKLDQTLMDLVLITGLAHRLPDARRQVAWVLGSIEDRRRIASTLPRYEENLRDFIRDPRSFTELHYSSQITYRWITPDGRRYWVRYRLRDADRGPDRGHLDQHESALEAPVEYVPRKAGDTRPRSYLRDEFRRRIEAGSVRYVLEVQVRPEAASGAPDPRALDCTEPWPESLHPFRELAQITLDRVTEDALASRTAFSPDIQPPQLRMPRARSADEPASLGHLFAILDDIITRLESGEPFPPGLESLIAKSEGSPEASGGRSAGAPRRVCVIGGGAAGLTVARDLTRLGHRVTVLEKALSVGGKSACFEIDGKAYDLGTHLCTSQYRELRRLAAEVDCPTEVTNQIVNFDLERRAVHVTGESFLNDIGTYTRLLALKQGAFPELGRPGLSPASQALAEPVGEWLDRNELRWMVRVLGADIGYTSSGYGYIDEPELPALYLLRMIELSGFLDTTQQRDYQGEWSIAGGFMNLWRRVADELTDVRVGVDVLAVERLADCVRVRTDAGAFEFDDLVLALPLEQSLAFLDADDEEHALFSRIRYNTYFTSVCSVRGLPRDGFYIVVQHSQGSSTKGRCTAFHHRYEDSDVYTIYSYLPPGGTLADVQRIIGEDVARLGGELVTIHTQKRWEFFPHVLSSDVKAGWFQRMEALQGQRRTFYTGSVLSFELIECTIAYSRELVGRFFSPAAGAVAEREAARAASPAGSGQANDRRHDRSADEIRRWLVDHLAAELRLPPASIDPHAAVERFGLDSVTANSLIGQFTDWIGFRVTPAVLVEHPTIDAVARYLAGEEFE